MANPYLIITFLKNWKKTLALKVKIIPVFSSKISKKKKVKQKGDG